VYASAAAAETKRRRLAWLVQAKFRVPRRFWSALREAVTPETVRRTCRGQYARAGRRAAGPADDSPAADQARCGGKARNGHLPEASASPGRQRPPGVLRGTGNVAAAARASCPCTPPLVRPD
jgi:hypothetical protein